MDNTNTSDAHRMVEQSKVGIMRGCVGYRWLSQDLRWSSASLTQQDIWIMRSSSYLLKGNMLSYYKFSDYPKTIGCQEWITISNLDVWAGPNIKMLLWYWGWQLPIKTSFSLVGFVDSCFVVLALKCPWRWTPTKTCVQRCFGSMNMCTLFFGTVRTLTWLLLLH